MRNNDLPVPDGSGRAKEDHITGPEAFVPAADAGDSVPGMPLIERGNGAAVFPRTRAAAWVLYDLANTIYAGTVTFLLAPNIHAGAAGITNSSAMIFAALVTPAAAAMADRTGRAGAYCSFATLVCIVAMAMFGAFTAPAAIIAAFFISTVFYHSALVFYNSLLPSVAPQHKMGLISGLGVGIGYVGTVLTLLIALPVQKHFGIQTAFFVTAAAFLVFALPCMILVRDRRRTSRERTSFKLWYSQIGEILATIRNLPGRPALMWFLIANFFAVDVLNTAILFYGRFIRSSFEGMAEAGTLTIFGHTIRNITDFIMIGGLAVNIPALGFGLLLGWMADRVGARKTFITSVACLSGGLLGAAAFGGWAPLMFLISICCFGGLGLAGIWTAGRKLLTQIVPGEHVARYFGLYGITTKVSVVGSTVCGVMIEAFGPRIALASQALPLLVSFFAFYMMLKAERAYQKTGSGFDNIRRPT